MRFKISFLETAIYTAEVAAENATQARRIAEEMDEEGDIDLERCTVLEREISSIWKIYDKAEARA